MSVITLQAHYCNRNWGAEPSVLIPTIENLFDQVNHRTIVNGNIIHLSVHATLHTESESTLTDDSANGALENLLIMLAKDYVPYNVRMVSHNENKCDVTYYLDSSKKMMKANSSGGIMYPCSRMPVPSN